MTPSRACESRTQKVIPNEMPHQTAAMIVAQHPFLTLVLDEERCPPATRVARHGLGIGPGCGLEQRIGHLADAAGIVYDDAPSVPDDTL